MKFRTEIEPLRHREPIDYSDRIVLLGSCFTTEVGNRLVTDGFQTTVNPMGALYNPASIAKIVNKALRGETYTDSDLTLYAGGYHNLDFPSTYQGNDKGALLERTNKDFGYLSKSLQEAEIWIITFGTSHIFELDGETLVGNCHKLPSTRFTDRYLEVDEIVELWRPLIQGRRIIFTVSPIRHLSDGLHGNQLSKARLLLAVERLCKKGAEYFPSYEIMLDDLRDYRFYASDMKHPSEVAVDYIYEKFSESYFSEATRANAMAARKAELHARHRQIL